MNTKGLYAKGKRHSQGGIDVIVDGIKPIEVEVGEYKLCSSAMRSKKIYTFKNKTNKEILDSLFSAEGCEFDPKEAESGDYIICRLVVNDTTKKTIIGKVQEIVDELQAEKQCVVSNQNNTNKMKKGGLIDNDKKIFEIELYEVRYGNDNFDEIKGIYNNLEDAELAFNRIDTSDTDDKKGYKVLNKKNAKYEFVYDLDTEFESINDFPISEYFEDNYYYEKIDDDSDIQEIKSEVIDKVNESSEKLLSDVEDYFHTKYGKWKYNTIIVDNGKDERNDEDYVEYGKIQLRIADHSENVLNIDKYGSHDFYLSVVVANKNATSKKFGASMYERRSNEKEIYFDGSNELEEVISEIETEIEEAKEYVLFKNADKFEKGGEIKIPKNNVTLYTKLTGEKTFKATDLKGNRVGNLVNAPLIKPEKYLEFKEAIAKTSKENPDVNFRIVEFGNNKVWYDSAKNELAEGIEVEKEHQETINKIASGEVAPEDAPEAIAKDHIEEDKNNYDKLEEVEKPNVEIESEYATEIAKLDELVATSKALNAQDKKGKKEIEHKIDMQTTELANLVSDYPFLYPKFLTKIYTLPKKHWVFTTPYDKDLGNEKIINWLKENDINIFDLVPIKEYTLPKQKAFKTSVDDSVFMSIHSEFNGNDNLRPSLLGINFNEFGVVSTDAHKLLFTKYRGEKPSKLGSYCATKKCFDEIERVTEERFPDWQRVVPKDNPTKKVLKAEYVLNYLKNALNLDMLNPTTKQALFNFINNEGENQEIGVSSHFFIESIETMIELGHKDLEVSFSESSRPILIYPLGKENLINTLGVDFTLCMPIYINEGVNGYKYGISSKPNFSYNLDTNCVNQEGIEKTYCFDAEKNELTSIKKELKKEIEEVKQIKKELELAKEERVDAEIMNEQFEETPDLKIKESVTESSVDNTEINEAIELLNDLLSDAKGKSKKEILEAINLLKDLL